MASLVVFEIGFGLWLVFGLYPKWTWSGAISLLVAFASFNVFLSLKGEKTCPCFGKGNIDPGLVALVEALSALGLVFCQPRANGPTLLSAPWRLYGFGSIYLLVSVPALLNMVYYSRQGLSLDLRSDKHLDKVLGHKLRQPSSEEILELLRESTDLEFTIDDLLRQRSPDYGYWSTGKAWSVMIAMGEKQWTPTRWEKTDYGYHLAVATPWGSSALPWILSSLVAGIIGLYLVQVGRLQGHEVLLRRFGF
ncbi:MAG: hypothetical protein HY040_16770 [Planctomycetes bacterium]|nr:hypothetical protein [Planctomycetota bacterium]